MRFTFSGRKLGSVLGIILLGLIIFVFLAQIIYGLLAGGAFRWLRQHDCPYNYPGSIWESEDPRIYLQVEDMSPDHAKAYLVADGETVSIIIDMDDRSGWVDIDDAGTKKLLLKGAVKASSDRVIIEVKEDLDYLFDGDYPVITLYRTDGG